MSLKIKFFISCFLVFSSLLLFLCGGEKGPKVIQAPKIRIKDNVGEIDLNNPKIVIYEAQYEIGKIYSYSLYIYNVGLAPLKINSIDFDYTSPQGSKEIEEDKAFSLEKPSSFPVEIAPIGKSKEFLLPEDLKINIKFKRFGDAFERTAIITINNNTYEEKYKTLKIIITTQKPHAKMEVIPDLVDFGLVKEGEFSQKDVMIMNNGGEDLKITGIKISGDTGYSVNLNENFYILNDETKKGKIFSEPVKIAPKGSTLLKVKYSPTSPDAAQSFVFLFNNDPEYKDGYKIELRANMGGPCLLANPTEVDFGSVMVGKVSKRSVELLSCGDLPLEINKIVFSENSSKDFSIDWNSSQFEQPSKDKPLYIQTNEKKKFYIDFTPQQEKKDISEKNIPDTGEVIIQNNTYKKELKIPVRGVAISGNCPFAEIEVKEIKLFDGVVQAKKIEGGIEVKPQSIIYLSGKKSIDPTPGGIITEYIWSVEQPVMSKSYLSPSHSFPEPSFECNIAGEYFFRLKVRNNFGIESCNTAELKVLVKAGEGLHIELMWHTPKDANEADEGPDKGSDLDLHFVHPYATGPDIDKDGKPDGYFHSGEEGIAGYDCFWFNPHPDWGIEKKIEDDPNLDRDDTDGAGPENLNLQKPEEGKLYKFGVHYWNDHGFGVSYATVIVYVDGIEMKKWQNVKLKHLDLWEIATIEFPGSIIKEILVNSAPKIVPNYVNSDFSFD